MKVLRNSSGREREKWAKGIIRNFPGKKKEYVSKKRGKLESLNVGRIMVLDLAGEFGCT